MGRGRAKAKQTKVARDLKYRTPETDFSDLQRELPGNDPGTPIEKIPQQHADLVAESTAEGTRRIHIELFAHQRIGVGDDLDLRVCGLQRGDGACIQIGDDEVL